MKKIKIFNITRDKFIKYLSFTFVCYAIPFAAIYFSNYPYLDDTTRCVMGYTGFGNDYSRWGSEILSRILQGSSHLVDTGLTNYLITALILAISSIILVFVISKLSYLTLFVSLLIGLNPWSLGLFSFRFDSPFMALSILMSIVPFLFWRRAPFVMVSFFSLFLMYNTYQASSGIFLVIFLIKFYRELTQSSNLNKVATDLIIGGISYLLPTIAYFIQLIIVPVATAHSSNSTVSSNIFVQPMINLYLYLTAVKDNTATLWGILFAVLLIVWIINEITGFGRNIALNILYLFLFLCLTSICSFGIYLFLQQITPALRYIYGFPFFLSCLAIMLAGSQGEKFKALYFVNKVIPAVLSFFILQFCFVYAGVLTNQREALQLQSEKLSDSISNTGLSGSRIFFSDNLFFDSAQLKNAQRNYPVLKTGYTQLILSNSQSSQELIRLQVMQNMYLNRHFAGTISDAREQIGEVDQTQLQNIKDGKAIKVLENDQWTIYSSEKEVYVIAKMSDNSAA
ncbi:MAG: glucosyltransferase domain-containing protein [Streptococcaceae bacterium]|jgi:hypothetical protein|nr:glucosyltransferase domain-containing protein [Streptococcaceae bacterium]